MFIGFALLAEPQCPRSIRRLILSPRGIENEEFQSAVSLTNAFTLIVLRDLLIAGVAKSTNISIWVIASLLRVMVKVPAVLWASSPSRVQSAKHDSCGRNNGNPDAIRPSKTAAVSLGSQFPISLLSSRLLT